MRKPEYKTTSIYLASFLLSQGAELTGYTRVSPRRFMFRFRADRQLHELLRLYWNDSIVLLAPKPLYDSLSYLKSLIRGHV